jgi:hypothetical protein
MSTWLFVDGDDDFGVLNMEENFSPEGVYVTMKENGVTETTIEEDGESFNAKILEFGDVDEKFWEFVQYNVCEEDMLKHRSIFLIKK